MTAPLALEENPSSRNGWRSARRHGNDVLADRYERDAKLERRRAQVIRDAMLTRTAAGGVVGTG